MRYESPESPEAAVALLQDAPGDAGILAGGTDLLVQIRTGVRAPDLILDLKRIAALRAITPEDGGLRIGAAVSSAELSEHPLAAGWPGVVEAAALIGSTQIQSRATLGGNLCNASPAADSVPAMVAAGAVARLIGPDGRRDLPVEELALGPGKTALNRAEFVESILLPKRPQHCADAYLRFIPRTEMDIAVVGAAVMLELDTEGMCRNARVALGAVAARVVAVPAAAQELIGSTLDDDTLARLEHAAAAACRPIDDKRGTKAFRTTVAGVLARRAALIAYARATA